MLINFPKEATPQKSTKYNNLLCYLLGFLKPTKVCEGLSFENFIPSAGWTYIQTAIKVKYSLTNNDNCMKC